MEYFCLCFLLLEVFAALGPTLLHLIKLFSYWQATMSGKKMLSLEFLQGLRKMRALQKLSIGSCYTRELVALHTFLTLTTKSWRRLASEVMTNKALSRGPSRRETMRFMSIARRQSSALHWLWHLRSRLAWLAKTLGLERLCRGCIGLAHEQNFGGTFSCTVGDVFYLQQLWLGVGLLLGLKLLLGLRTRRYLWRLWICASLSCRMTNQSPITTTCTSIGPHPSLLTLRMTDLSIPLGGRNLTSQ